MTETRKQAFSKRAIVSMFVFFSFILLPLSGVPLHFARTAAAPGKLEHFLMSVHNMSALIFLAAAVVHLCLNWNAFAKYIVQKTSGYARFRREMLIALVATVLLVGLFSSHALHVH
jgi:hypothetical protein